MKEKLDEIEIMLIQQKQAEEEARRASGGANGLADAETLKQKKTVGEETYLDKTDTEDDQDMLDSVEEQSEDPENGAWVDDLYRKMIAGDAEGVYAIIEGSDFIEKCSEFEHGDLIEICTEYGLLTSDGKKVGVIYLHDTYEGYDTYIAVHCIHDEADAFVAMYCPREVAIGDYFYSVDSIGNDTKSWFAGNVWHYADGRVEELQGNGGVLTITVGLPEDY